MKSADMFCLVIIPDSGLRGHYIPYQYIKSDAVVPLRPSHMTPVHTQSLHKPRSISR